MIGAIYVPTGEKIIFETEVQSHVENAILWLEDHVVKYDPRKMRYTLFEPTLRECMAAKRYVPICDAGALYALEEEDKWQEYIKLYIKRWSTDPIIVKFFTGKGE